MTDLKSRQLQVEEGVQHCSCEDACVSAHSEHYCQSIQNPYRALMSIDEVYLLRPGWIFISVQCGMQPCICPPLLVAYSIAGGPCVIGMHTCYKQL